MKLLTDPQGNPKTNKSMKGGYYTPVLHMLPANLSGFNVCPKASEGCKMACLNTAGRGGIIKKGETTNVIQEARRKRTLMYFQDRKGFYSQLSREIKNAENRAKKRGLKLAVRLNGTSDYNFYDIIEEYPNVQFYDYSKVYNRVAKPMPKNYHITLSYSEANKFYANKVIEHANKFNKNIAVVFRDKNNIPKTFLGREVINGDKDDLRFLDKENVVVALYAKGDAKKDKTGFVIDN